MFTAGLDLGSGAVKVAVFSFPDRNGEPPSISTDTPEGTRWVARRVERIRRRDPLELAERLYDEALEELGIRRDDVAYAATTGEGESLALRTGHFYSMTTHARGAIHLEPEARSVLDIGALHGRAMAIDSRGKVLAYKMTSQCASGSGQFLENIARYLGIAQDEIGPLSLQADAPETVSSICAVLAETDVINMVSRGISAPNILKGIHLSMADRFAKLLRVVKAEPGITFLSGGLAGDVGLTAAINESLEALKLPYEARTHPDAIFAGAIGAALWGEYRHRRLAASGALAGNAA